MNNRKRGKASLRLEYKAMIYQKREAKFSTKMMVLVGLPVFTAVAYFVGFHIYAIQQGF